MKAGLIDLHYRDYEEPPGNGGFLCNGGRIYIDMGHLEYASPECRNLADAVSYDFAGDRLLQSAVEQMGVADEVAFFRNNVDHHTGATFGCHENYSMNREMRFDDGIIGTLLSFLVTRQIFTGAGRVGQALPSSFEAPPSVRRRLSIFNFPNAPTTSSTTSINGFNSTAPSSMRAMNLSRIFGNTADCTC